MAHHILLSLLAILGSLRGSNHKIGLSTKPDPRSLNFLVFAQPADSLFITNIYPELEQFAAERSIAVQIINPTVQGCPAEITATPAIVYQNELGRSVFAGRLTDFTGIRNFYRNVKLRPQKSPSIIRDSVVVARIGRFSLAAKMKVTAPQGQLAQSQIAHFETEAWAGIQQGLSGQVLQRQAILTRTDRTFYFDYHPYMGADGQLYLSLALFSQFNCHEPIFTTDTLPVLGKLKKVKACFSMATQRLFEQSIQALQNSEEGDQLTPITGMIPIKDWSVLGLVNTSGVPLSITLNNRTNTAVNLKGYWQTAGLLDTDVPICLFRFAEPLDRYAGEVKSFTGQWSITDKGLEVGKFEADLRTISCGSSSLDRYVLGPYLQTTDFPKASFALASVRLSETWTIGQTAELDIPGRFVLKGMEHTLLVRAQLTPISSDSIAVSAQFQMDVARDFGLKTPDGPAPSCNFVEVDLHFWMVRVPLITESPR